MRKSVISVRYHWERGARISQPRPHRLNAGENKEERPELSDGGLDLAVWNLPFEEVLTLSLSLPLSLSLSSYLCKAPTIWRQENVQKAVSGSGVNPFQLIHSRAEGRTDADRLMVGSPDSP